jgi:hypothetical protein
VLASYAQEQTNSVTPVLFFPQRTQKKAMPFI